MKQKLSELLGEPFDASGVHAKAIKLHTSKDTLPSIMILEHIPWYRFLPDAAPLEEA